MNMSQTSKPYPVDHKPFNIRSKIKRISYFYNSTRERKITPKKTTRSKEK